MTAGQPAAARHSGPTLLALEQLHVTMNDGATEHERNGWWTLVLRAQSSIDDDSYASKADHDAMRRLREGVSEVDGTPNRGYAPATRLQLAR